MHEAMQQTAVEQERSRIARDLHDSVAQHLALALLKLEHVQRTLTETPEYKVQPDLKHISHLIQAGLQDLQHCIWSLQPWQLERQSLTAALQSLLQGYQDILAITCNISDLSLIPSHLEGAIFRFLQEALTNIHRHANASHVTLNAYVHRGSIEVEVSDNGRGFDINEHCKTHTMMHYGLRIMQERIRLAGGTWHLQSLPGRGTTIKATFPLTSERA
jgi:signal transduction histidine kinase